MKRDDKLVCWGVNYFGQTTIPAGLGHVVSVSAGEEHTCALTSDQSVHCWGLNIYGQTIVPAGLSTVVAVGAGIFHSCALQSNGRVTCWGNNELRQTDVPASLAGVVALSVGEYHNCALKIDGTVTCWGDNSGGQIMVPAGLNLGRPSIPKTSELNIDQANLVTNGLSTCNGLYGQTFVPQTAKLHHVDVLLTVNTIAATGDATTLGLFADLTQPPIAITSVTVAPAEPGELSRIVSYAFPSPVRIRKGTTYTLGWSGGTACWEYSLGDTYSAGGLVSFDGTPLNPPADAWFITYSK